MALFLEMIMANKNKRQARLGIRTCYYNNACVSFYFNSIQFNSTRLSSPLMLLLLLLVVALIQINYAKKQTNSKLGTKLNEC